MAQIKAISGRRAKAKIAKIIHKKKREARILLVFLNKIKPKTMRNTMISPLAKKKKNK